MPRALTVPLTLLACSALLTACGEVGSKMPPITSSRPDEGETPAAAGARRIEVGARSFAFDPDEITVRAGEDIVIVLASQDSLHDFVVDDLDTRVAAQVGKTAVGGFRADEPGRYTYYCSVTGHRRAGMQGTLVVTTS